MGTLGSFLTPCSLPWNTTKSPGGKDQRRASQDGSWAGCLSAEPLADPRPWGPVEEPTCLAGKQRHGPADLARGQEPAQRLVGVRRKPERPVPFHLELAPAAGLQQRTSRNRRGWVLMTDGFSWEMRKLVGFIRAPGAG